MKRKIFYFIITALLFPTYPAFAEDISSNNLSVFVFQHQAVSGKKGQFVARTSDKKVIELARKELSKPESKRRLAINGRLAAGGDTFNSPWHWHIEDNKWSLVQQSTEVCDGTPEMVEKDVQYWVETVKRFCPFKSYVFKEITPDK